MPVWLDMALMATTVAAGAALLLRAVWRHSRCEACPANPSLMQRVQHLAGGRQRKGVTELRLGRQPSAARASASTASRG